MNIAQRLLVSLGCHIQTYAKSPRNSSFTKKGPGRRHQSPKKRRDPRALEI